MTGDQRLSIKYRYKENKKLFENVDHWRPETICKYRAKTANTDGSL